MASSWKGLRGFRCHFAAVGWGMALLGTALDVGGTVPLTDLSGVEVGVSLTASLVENGDEPLMLDTEFPEGSEVTFRRPTARQDRWGEFVPLSEVDAGTGAVGVLPDLGEAKDGATGALTWQALTTGSANLLSVGFNWAVSAETARLLGTFEAVPPLGDGEPLPPIVGNAEFAANASLHLSFTMRFTTPPTGDTVLVVPDLPWLESPYEHFSASLLDTTFDPLGESRLDWEGGGSGGEVMLEPGRTYEYSLAYLGEVPHGVDPFGDVVLEIGANHTPAASAELPQEVPEPGTWWGAAALVVLASTVVRGRRGRLPGASSVA